MDKAFTSSKMALAKATMPDAHISLTSDALDWAIGAVLEQHVNGV